MLILRDILGLSQTDISALEAAGTISNVPPSEKRPAAPAGTMMK
jgi:hypothetical protein